MIEWLSHDAVIEAPDAEAAEAEARRLWDENAEHEVFSFDDFGIDGIQVDEEMLELREPHSHQGSTSKTTVWLRVTENGTDADLSGNGDHKFTPELDGVLAMLRGRRTSPIRGRRWRRPAIVEIDGERLRAYAAAAQPRCLS